MTNDSSSTPADSGHDAAAANTAEALYAFADCERVDLQQGAVLLLHRKSTAQMIVAPEVAFALTTCRAFRTLEQHVDFLTGTVPQLAGQHESVRNILALVKEAGLFTNATEEWARLYPAPVVPAVDLAPTRVFIITCDRPAALQRLLQSMLMAGGLSKHEQIFLVDDSRDAGNAEANREAVSQFNLTSPRNMQYLGADQQQTLLDNLVTALPEQEDGIRFLIDRQRWAARKSYGLARTTCLLLSVGCRAIVMDDDVICAAVSPVNTRDGVLFGDTEREVEFFSSEQDILDHTQRADFDPLGGHSQCLGLTLSQALQKLGDDQLTAANLNTANSLFTGHWHADSPVLITQCGSIGDPGTADNSWLYTLDPRSTERLLEAPGGLESALERRYYWLGHAKPQFTKSAVISQVTGLDNSHLLPPYFPVFRGEDRLFGAMTEFLHPDAAVLEYEWCVPHFPIEGRQASGKRTEFAGLNALNPGKYLLDRFNDEPGISIDTRLQELTLIARDLAESTDDGLRTLFRAEFAATKARQVARYGATLQDGASRPDSWQKYLQQAASDASKAMQSQASLADTWGKQNGMDEAEVLSEFRALVGGFATALEGWRDIRHTAKTITEQMLADSAFNP